MREGWEYKKLGEVCCPKNKIQRAARCFDSSDKILYIDISSIDNTMQKVTDITSVTFGDAPSRAQQKIEYGDIVVSTVRPNLKNIAIIDRYEPNIVASSGFCVLRNTECIERNYLFHYVTSDIFTQHLMKITTGANYPAVRDQDVRDSIIPLPPKSTQLAIVSELDKISELIRLKKEQLKDFENIAQSIFYEMFGDPVENEMGWEVKKLGDVCSQITDGTHNSPINTKDGEFKYITAKNIKKEGIVLDNITYVDADTHHSIYSRCNPKYGDILYIKDGVTTGIATINNLDEEFSLLSSVALLKLEDKIINYYLKAVLNTKTLYNCIRTNMGGAAITRLTLVKIKAIKIPLPPLHLQQLFANRIEQIEHQKAEVQKAIADLETLLASRMQYWFE
ncbi:restriction endonuclease subunit S [Prevotellamassilia timonensis]|uniref:restriction endonuclease subunit S n=1 Tax=Prevotellamassilia timonensis TaxID=1852370 RepID=UPI00307980CB